MSKKIRNTKRLWYEEGYSIQNISGTTMQGFFGRGKTCVVMDVKFKLIDGTPVSFEKEWKKIKRLAKRQNMRAIPVAETYGDGADNLSHLLLVSDKMIEGARDDARKVANSLEKSYWLIQGLPEAIEVKEELFTLYVTFKNLCKRASTHTGKQSASGSLENLYETWVKAGQMFVKLGSKIKEIDELKDQRLSEGILAYYSH